MTIQIFSKKETAEIIEKLNKQFGIKKLPGIVLRIGQERLFLYIGSLNENEIRTIEETVPIERAGVYFAKDQDGIRLSIEGIHLLKDQITKNIYEIENEKDLETWMHGSELNVKSGFIGYVIMKYREDFVGSGKASAEKITNFIPKSRRLKFKN